MASVRRMTSRRGGVGGPVYQPGSPGNTSDAQARTLPSGLTVAKPYRVGASPAALKRSPWLDPSTIMFWRWVFLGAALLYVAGYHLSVGRLRVRI